MADRLSSGLGEPVRKLLSIDTGDKPMAYTSGDVRNHLAAKDFNVYLAGRCCFDRMQLKRMDTARSRLCHPFR